METYARKTDIFHAIQYTGDNREKIIDALGIPKEDCQCWINEDTKDSYLVIKDIPIKVNPKMWIFVSSSGIRNAVPDDFFADKYQRVWIKE